MNRQSSSDKHKNPLSPPTPLYPWQTCPTKPEIPAARKPTPEAGRYIFLGSELPKDEG